MASIATGFHVPLGRLLGSQGRLALMATAGIIFLCRQIMNCAGVRVLLGLAGHDSVRVSILFFIFVAVAIGYPVSSSRRGKGKIRVYVWIKGWDFSLFFYLQDCKVGNQNSKLYTFSFFPPYQHRLGLEITLFFLRIASNMTLHRHSSAKKRQRNFRRQE